MRGVRAISADDPPCAERCTEAGESLSEAAWGSSLLDEPARDEREERSDRGESVAVSFKPPARSDGATVRGSTGVGTADPPDCDEDCARGDADIGSAAAAGSRRQVARTTGREAVTAARESEKSSAAPVLTVRGRLGSKPDVR